MSKKYSDNHRLGLYLKKIVKDTQNSKGSKSITGEQSIEFSENNFGWKSGFSSKPYDYNENRSGRTTVSPSEDRIKQWEENPTDVYPIGIKNEEICSYHEQIKILKKLLGELCGVKDVPQNFINDVKNLGIEPKPVHYDYMEYNRQIRLDDIDKNTHKGKEKGLEFCHLTPKDGTRVENVTIGLSSSNRKQSGNSLHDMAYYGFNAVRIQKGFEPITEELFNELIKTTLSF